MTLLRQQVAVTRHDPDCATESKPSAFTHVPHPIDRVPGMPFVCGPEAIEQCIVSDMAAYSEWFAAECLGREMVASTSWIAEVALLTPHRLSKAATAEVAHLMRTARDPLVLLACRDEIERRWSASTHLCDLRDAITHDLQQAAAGAAT